MSRCAIIIAHRFDRAIGFLQSLWTDLDRGAEMLLTRETVSAEDFPAIRPVGSIDAKSPGNRRRLQRWLRDRPDAVRSVVLMRAGIRPSGQR